MLYCRMICVVKDLLKPCRSHTDIVRRRGTGVPEIGETSGNLIGAVWNYLQDIYHSAVLAVTWFLRFIVVVLIVMVFGC